MSEIVPGQPVVSHCVSLCENFTRLAALIHEAFDAPLTDLKDDADDDAIPSQSLPTQQPPPIQLPQSSSNPKTFQANKRSRARRLVKRSAAQQANNTHLKAVSLKRRSHAPVKKLPFNVARDVRASKPGWTGTSSELGSLNGRQTISVEEGKEIGLVELEWDGR